MASFLSLSSITGTVTRTSFATACPSSTTNMADVPSPTAWTARDQCKISMTLNWYTTGACFILPFPIAGPAAFAGTCLVAALIAFILQCLKQGRQQAEQASRRPKTLCCEKCDCTTATPHNLSGPTLAGTASGASSDAAAATGSGSTSRQSTGSANATSPNPSQQADTSKLHSNIYVAVVHMLEFLLEDLNMMLMMSYNGFIIISILVGTLLGHVASEKDAPMNLFALFGVVWKQTKNILS